jgi:hypothetical protein
VGKKAVMSEEKVSKAVALRTVGKSIAAGIRELGKAL